MRVAPSKASTTRLGEEPVRGGADWGTQTRPATSFRSYREPPSDRMRRRQSSGRAESFRDNMASMLLPICPSHSQSPPIAGPVPTQLDERGISGFRTLSDDKMRIFLLE